MNRELIREIRTWASDKIEEEKLKMTGSLMSGLLVTRSGVRGAELFVAACDSVLAERRREIFTPEHIRRIDRAVTAARKAARLAYPSGVRGVSKTDTLSLLHQGIQFLYEELLAAPEVRP